MSAFDDLDIPNNDYCDAAPNLVYDKDGVETTPKEQCAKCVDLLTSGEYVARYSHEAYEVEAGKTYSGQEQADREIAAKVCVLDIQKDMNPGNNPETIIVTEQV